MSISIPTSSNHYGPSRYDVDNLSYYNNYNFSTYGKGWDDHVRSCLSIASFMFNVGGGSSGPSVVDPGLTGVASKATDTTRRLYTQALIKEGLTRGADAWLTAGNQMARLAGEAPRADFSTMSHQRLNSWLEQHTRAVQPGTITASGNPRFFNFLRQERWQAINNSFRACSWSTIFGVGVQNTGQVGRSFATAGMIDPKTLGMITDKTKQMGLLGLFKGGWSNFGQQWRTAMTMNFKDVGLHAVKNMSVGGYIKNLVGGNWLRGISEYLATGRGLFGAVLGSANILVNALNVGLTAVKAFKLSQRNGEGLGQNILRAVVAGGKTLATTLIAYEVGAICFTFAAGFTALPVLGIAAGLAGAAAGGVATAYLMKKLWGPSIPPELARHDV